METSPALDFLSTLIPLIGVVFLIALGVVLLNLQFRKNLYKHQLAREALKKEHHRELMRNAMEVQEEERNRFARDLHDELGAFLSMGRMEILQLEEQELVSATNLKKVRQLLEQALTSTRRISHEIVPLQLSELGLEQSIQSLVSKGETAGKITIHTAFSIALTALPQQLEIHLFRICAELINNTLKHAQATEISISLLQRQSILFCQYSDNGKGLPADNFNKGMGLKNLEARVVALQGSFEIGPQQTSGFSVQIKIPLEDFTTSSA